MILHLIAAAFFALFVLFLLLIWAELAVNAYIELPPAKRKDLHGLIAVWVGLILLYFFV